MGMRSLERVASKPGVRRRRYGSTVADVVRIVWESLDYVCAERLTPVLQDTARQLARWEELVLTPEVEGALDSISRATVQRLLKGFRRDTPRLPLRKPQPPNRLLQGVPMERLSWRTESPGSFEADLVHHCGAIASGDYVYTLQLVDIATGWSERVAIFGRSQDAMVRGFQKIQQRLPFPIQQLHPDNGSEFSNDHLSSKHDKAKTPYQRLLDCGILSPGQKTRLKDLYTGTNPRQLREAIYRAVEQLRQTPVPNIIINQRRPHYFGNILK